jgi:hypothetical protein
MPDATGYSFAMRTTPLVLASLSLLALSACAPAVDPQDGAMEGMPHVTISWVLENEKTDDTGMTTADVSLQLRTSADDVEKVALGNYAGCGEESMPSDGALLTLKCWWAGGGDEFQVRMEGTGTLSIDHRGLDEMTDIPEFEPMKSVEIPEGAMIMTTGKKTV